MREQAEPRPVVQPSHGLLIGVPPRRAPAARPPAADGRRAAGRRTRGRWPACSASSACRCHRGISSRSPVPSSGTSRRPARRCGTAVSDHGRRSSGATPPRLRAPSTVCGGPGCRPPCARRPCSRRCRATDTAARRPRPSSTRVARLVRLSPAGRRGRRPGAAPAPRRRPWPLCGDATRTITPSWPAPRPGLGPAEAAGRGVPHASGHGARLGTRSPAPPLTSTARASCADHTRRS